MNYIIVTMLPYAWARYPIKMAMLKMKTISNTLTWKLKVTLTIQEKIKTMEFQRFVILSVILFSLVS